MKRKQKSVKRIIEALLFVAVLALGWRYPYLAYCLVLNVAVGLVGALRHGGRHGCGTFCPRGAFYSLLPDTKRKVPAGLLERKASIAVMIMMFAGLAIWLRPSTIRSWGMLMYIMIVITTTIGLVGWLVFNRYFWCSVCPMGKIYKFIQPNKSGIRVASTCVKCGLCAKTCPFGFFPPNDTKDGVFRNPDCMHCRRCIEKCPKQALSMEA
ncbi:MAG: 4Fe-4S binding protein [Lentisphaeria bacterium]|nr:4Fe-4S binding protein [Lentisphaeria bacterium]